MTSERNAPFGMFQRPFPMPESRAGMSGIEAAITATVDAVDLPLTDWDRWARSVVLDACWEAQDAPAILDRARALGWTP